MRRIQQRFLLHSRWTALRPLANSQGECHFDVIEVVKPRAMSNLDAQVTLRAILTGQSYRVPTAQLRDESAWAMGWTSLPGEPNESR